jgi:hypothetical protein
MIETKFHDFVELADFIISRKLDTSKNLAVLPGS